LTRVSTNVFGVAGNGENLDVAIPLERLGGGADPVTRLHPAITNDGAPIVFTTSEALSPVDGNGEPDVYIWTPEQVSLISAGSVGSAAIKVQSQAFHFPSNVSIDGSGQDIYFETPGALTPADGDDSGDVYDARIRGGFGFASTPRCSDEQCQPDPTPPPPKKQPNSVLPGPGNPPLRKSCPKGKVRKRGRCVKKARKHSGKKQRGKPAAHNRGGGK
jgi:hypothetical protein